MNKYKSRLFTIGFDVIVVLLMYFAFHGLDMRPTESAIWVLCALCFVRLGIVLQMLKEKDEETL